MRLECRCGFSDRLLRTMELQLH